MSETNGEIRVKFGPGESDHMPLSWAVKMLETWRRNDPQKFGSYLAEAATGSIPKARRDAS